MRRELVLIAIPNPVKDERRTDRMAFTLSCKNSKESKFVSSEKNPETEWSTLGLWQSK